MTVYTQPQPTNTEPLEHTMWAVDLGWLNYATDRATGAAIDWAESLEQDGAREALNWARHVGIKDAIQDVLSGAY